MTSLVGADDASNVVSFGAKSRGLVLRRGYVERSRS